MKDVPRRHASFDSLQSILFENINLTLERENIFGCLIFQYFNILLYLDKVANSEKKGKVKICYLVLFKHLKRTNGTKLLPQLEASKSQSYCRVKQI